MRELPLHPVAPLRSVALANGKQREEPLCRPGVEVFGAVGSLIKGHGGVNGGHHRAQSTHTTRARTVPDAARYEKISYLDVLTKELNVMDAAAISLCKDNDMPLLVFKPPIISKPSIWNGGLLSI